MIVYHNVQIQRLIPTINTAAGIKMTILVSHITIIPHDLCSVKWAENDITEINRALLKIHCQN